MIHICPPFWELPVIGSPSQAGVLIHEAAHFQGTVDYASKKDDCKELARTYPFKTTQNAASYMYFAENYPKID